MYRIVHRALTSFVVFAQALTEARGTVQDGAGYRPEPLEAFQCRRQADLVIHGGWGRPEKGTDHAGGPFFRFGHGRCQGVILCASPEIMLKKKKKKEHSGAPPAKLRDFFFNNRPPSGFHVGNIKAKNSPIFCMPQCIFLNCNQLQMRNKKSIVLIMTHEYCICIYYYYSTPLK